MGVTVQSVSYRGAQLEIVVANIAMLEVDAIVNAANSCLVAGASSARSTGRRT